MLIENHFKQRRGVVRVADCRLQLGSCQWEFARERREEIQENWRRRTAENPALFDGRVLMMRPPSIAEQVLTAELVEVDFKAYLFWRDSGFPDAGLFDGFGSALIRSREGHVLLGRQRGGNLNAGLVYLPGGFIDGRDVLSGGLVDIDASIARELKEETGLGAEAFSRAPGYLVTLCGPQISIAVEYRSVLSAQELRLKMLSAIAKQSEPELSDIVIVPEADAHRADGAQGDEFAEYVRVLMPAIFSCGLDTLSSSRSLK